MTSIFATVGPSLRTPDAVRAAVSRGARGFRFPASKHDPATLDTLAREVAAIAAELAVEVDLFLDLPGRKVRLISDEEVSLSEVAGLNILYEAAAAPEGGDPSIPGVRLVGAAHMAPIAVGDVLLLGDGEDALRVAEAHPGHCFAVPLTGGRLGFRRGMAVQGKPHALAGLTERDMSTLSTLSTTSFTGVFVSYVESASEVRKVQEILADSHREPPVVVAKVETSAGVADIEEIAGQADGVLLGRGDLLMDVGVLDFHAASQRVVDHMAKSGKPLIVGTQLLTSLSDSWLPHRSEISCLCDLIAKGVAGLLLSDETTVGRDPGRTVRVLAELISAYGTVGGALFR